MYSKEEKKNLIQRFWTQFSEYCAELPQFKNRRRKWMLHHTKVRGMQLKFDAGRNGVAVALELTHRDENERIEFFEKLEQCKSLLEKGFEKPFIWEPFFELPEEKIVGRIYLLAPEYDIHKEEQWPQMFDFMARNMLQLERNFKNVRILFEE